VHQVRRLPREGQSFVSDGSANGFSNCHRGIHSDIIHYYGTTPSYCCLHTPAPHFHRLLHRDPEAMVCHPSSPSLQGHDSSIHKHCPASPALLIQPILKQLTLLFNSTTQTNHAYHPLHPRPRQPRHQRSRVLAQQARRPQAPELPTRRPQRDAAEARLRVQCRLPRRAQQLRRRDLQERHIHQLRPRHLHEGRLRCGQHLCHQMLLFALEVSLSLITVGCEERDFANE
jgi:hypothetical protein